MPVTYETSGVITNAGITAAIAAGNAGPQINVSGYHVGSNSAVQGAVARVTDTEVDGLVYTGTIADMSYTAIDADTVVWRIRLNFTVGTFFFGNVGLVLQDGTLFCKAVMPGQGTKYPSDANGTVGNTVYINVIMRLINAASLLNLTFITSLDCNLPEVSTELLLPSPQATVFDTYLVDNHTHVGVPTTSVRFNNSWWHAPHRLYPGEGSGVVVAQAGRFGGNVNIGETVAPSLGPVGFSVASNVFVAGDGADPQLFCVGIRTSSFEVMVLGTIPGASIGLTGTLVPFTAYYAGTGAAVGTLVTTPPNGDVVCVATSASDVYVDTTGAFMRALGKDVTDEQVLADLLALIAFEAAKQRVSDARAREADERIFRLEHLRA